LEAEAIAEMAATQNFLGNRELAIIFYKQAIEVFESRRDDVEAILGVSANKSQLFSPVYRRLSDLLLTEDRPAEAQQTVDLLKVQEVEEYLGDVRGNSGQNGGNLNRTVETLPQEQAILATYDPLRDQAIALGKELLALRRTPSVELTPAQQDRIKELTQIQQDITRQFSEFSRSPEVKNALQNISDTAREQNLSLNTLRSIADNLRQLDEPAVILYPLVLEDRLELIVASPFAPPIRRTVDVSRTELNATIVEMRQALTTERHNTANEPARKLYNWLIAPIQGDLQAVGATTIIYAPDDQLRYVPLSVLNDGDRWLIEKYRVSNITAASLTDFTSQRPNVLNILAGAFTEGEYAFHAGTRDFAFEGLPFAGKEVNNIASAIPATTTLFDGNFSKADTVPQMDSFNIVHLATHAAFVPGKPEDSFILFGNGDRTTLGEVKDSWFLTNVDLIVLSACQTAVGGELGNGEEILGFGYLMQDAGARAAIASLWSVSDGGTQALMNRFYEQLNTGNVSKAEALRQAQIAMIKGELTVDGSVGDTANPYYWSPFILIGNGL
ncbi:MAG: CHAT domain-containing protein, partial [Limnothrix sp.]